MSAGCFLEACPRLVVLPALVFERRAFLLLVANGCTGTLLTATVTRDSFNERGGRGLRAVCHSSFHHQFCFHCLTHHPTSLCVVFVLIQMLPPPPPSPPPLPPPPPPLPAPPRPWRPIQVHPHGTFWGHQRWPRCMFLYTGETCCSAEAADWTVENHWRSARRAEVKVHSNAGNHGKHSCLQSNTSTFTTSSRPPGGSNVWLSR